MSHKSKKLFALVIITIWVAISIYLLSNAERSSVAKDIYLPVVEMISSGGL